jgi:hypothetical protein
MTNAQRPALPAAGEKQLTKQKTAIVQKQVQKTRRVPAVRCTLCWAAFWKLHNRILTEQLKYEGMV